jgi:hypothetical protein
MVKKILLLAVVILVGTSSFGSNNDTLSKIENSLFGFDYSGDKTQNRVSRLEKTIYGKTSGGDINKRITKLSGDISADVIGLEIEPSRDTFLAEEKAIEDSSVDYPIVNEIEQKLFNKTYKNRDLHTRIVTIEKKLFGKIYDVDDYSKRMDRIKEKMYPQALANYDKNEIDYGDGSYYNDRMLGAMDLSGTGQSRFKMPFGQRKYTRPYTNFGDFSSVNDAIIPRDNLSDDLSQMEYDMFGTEFSSDDTQTRIKRLNSVNKAKKSSKKYDSQKFQQHMSTAMEIGAMILMILAMVL